MNVMKRSFNRIISRLVIISIAFYLPGCSGTLFESLTGSKSVIPTVLSVNSSDNNTIEVKFSTTLDRASSETSTNYLVAGLNIFSASLSGDTVTLTSSSQDPVSYTIEISGVSSDKGVPMTAYSGSFTGLSPAVSDTTAPTLQGITVENNNTLLATFSEAVDETGSETTANYTIPGLTVTDAVRLPENNARVRLTTSNQSGISYTLTVSGVTDFAGNAIGTPNSLGFTGDARPTVDSVSVTDNTHVTVTFSEDLDPATANTAGNYIIKKTADSSILSVNAVSACGTQVIVTTASQEAGIGYTIKVIGVRDLTGNIVITNSETFTGSGAPDSTPPTLLSAEAVDADTLRLTFSESVDTITAETTGNYSLTGGSYTVTGATMVAGNTAQVDLELSSVTAGETLTVEVINVTDKAAVPNLIVNNGTTNVAVFTADALPALTSAAATGNTSARLTFSEEITAASSQCSVTTSCGLLYSLSPGLTVYSASRVSSTQVDIITSAQLNRDYTVTVTPGSIADVNGNTLQSGNTATFTGTSTDMTPPALLGVTALTSSTLEIRFSEAVTAATAETAANYTLSSGTVSSAALQTNPSLVVVTLAPGLSDGSYTLDVGNIKDISLNSLYPNPSTSSFTVNFTLPGITAVYQYDCDTDGNIDEVVFEFTKSLNDSTIGDSDAGSFKISGTSFTRVDSNSGGTGAPSCSNGTGAGLDPGDPNDRFITLFTNDTTVKGTDAKSIGYTASPGRMEDLYGNGLGTTGIAPGDPAINDLAAPVIIKTSCDTGSTPLKVIFSENVKTTGGSGVCNSPATDIDAASDLFYTDTSVGNVSSISNSDMNGCDDATITVDGNLAFLQEDLFTDTLAVLNGAAVYDLAGNAASTTAVKISGIIHPYVLNVVSVNSTTARVTYSEPVLADSSGSAADTLGNYTYSIESDPLATGCTAGISAVSEISSTVFELTTNTQNIDCSYRLAVANVVDVNEGSLITDPKFGTFAGNEQLKVVSAEALSLSTFIIQFSKNILATGTGGADNTSYYTIPASLGTVTSSVRYDSVTSNGADANKVLVTHSTAQGVGVYSAVVSTSLRNEGDTEYLAPNPKDRTNFIGFGGSIETIEDGSLFTDPFADGTSFAFAFAYGGKIYMGPNDTNEGVFRFDPDGANSTLVTFINSSGTSNDGATTFGTNYNDCLTAASGVITNPSGTTFRYQLPGSTNLENIPLGGSVTVGSCTNAGNNGTFSITGIDDANDWFEVDNASGIAGGTETCSVNFFDYAGPAGMSGIDAFVGVTSAGYDYLFFGGHKCGGGGFGEAYFTSDVDTVLDNNYCSVSNIDLGNTQSLQSIYGDGNYVYLGFASDGTKAPLFGYAQMTGADTCNAAVDLGTGSNEAHYIDYLGTSGTNPNSFPAGIDSVTKFGTKLFIANNGGIAYTTTLPPTSASQFDDETNGDVVACDAIGGGVCNYAWSTGGTTQSIPGIGKLRPGEKGIPFMVPFDGSGSSLLYIARNRSDNGTAELWTFDGNSAWSANPVIKTGDTVTGGSVTGTDISMVTVNGSRLYVGFDDATNGAQVFSTTDGTNFTKLGEDGFGPVGDDLSKNKHIFSSAAIFYDGKDYLYITIGCASDFSDNGDCDRDPGTGTTDFSIKIFRQIDE